MKIYLITFNIFKKAIVCVTLIFGILSVNSFAQDAGALQRELQRQVDRLTPAPELELQKPKEPGPVNPDEQKFNLKGFNFAGNKLISNEQLQELVKPWENTPIGYSDLRNVTTAIQDYYSKQGRIASAIFPPQEVVNETLVIEIHEGKLGAVIFEPAEPNQIARFSSEEAQKYLMNDIETATYINTVSVNRGLALLNDLPGVEVSGTFEPGKGVDESDLRVKLKDNPFFTGQVGLSNFGAPSTGVAQALAVISFNNITGVGDQAILSTIQSIGSSYTQLGYSRPVGYDGFSAGIQGSYLSYSTLESWSDLTTQGSSNTFKVYSNYSLLRELDKKSNLNISIEQRNYNNTQLGNNISQYQVTAMQAGINGSFYDSTPALINYSLNGTFGNLSISNLSQASQDYSGPVTTGNYQKLSLTISRNQELSWLTDTNWLVSFYGQIANKNLNSSEQIFMGGPYALRAYPIAQGGGSQGMIITTELQHRIDQNWQVGTFVDVGFVQQYVTPYQDWQGLTHANNNYQLGDVGLSLKFTYLTFMFNAALAYRIGDNPLYNSSGQQLNNDNLYRKVQGWISATYFF
jgi:hypothetical protein